MESEKEVRGSCVPVKMRLHGVPCWLGRGYTPESEEVRHVTKLEKKTVFREYSVLLVSLGDYGRLYLVSFTRYITATASLQATAVEFGELSNPCSRAKPQLRYLKRIESEAREELPNSTSVSSMNLI